MNRMKSGFGVERTRWTRVTASTGTVPWGRGALGLNVATRVAFLRFNFDVTAQNGTLMHCSSPGLLEKKAGNRGFMRCP